MSSIGGDLYAQFELMSDEQRDQIINDLLDRWLAKHFGGDEIADDEREVLRMMMAAAVDAETARVRTNVTKSQDG